jgi:hypothetical protein
MIPENGLERFPQCMPDQYKHDNPVMAYHNYYIGEKAGFSKWTNREVPWWFVGG